MPPEGHVPEYGIFRQSIEGDRVKLKSSSVRVVFEPPSTLLASPDPGVMTIAAAAATTTATIIVVVDAAIVGGMISGAATIVK